MKTTNTSTAKIEELRKLNENKKCFDCHEKVILSCLCNINNNYREPLM